ncbi:uncharacterized protein B0H64DRAFT_390102 [Chaetomium fimeti]|uniref:Transmembrane protein n=1 Tax=Chaetomium fimeti TaxID=1854472 RepID=A0AAE0LT97_9PEZI|nr:hypothetical protein B0H64DRAFT_390102 [Chaetomium fimeti]
MLPGRVSAFIVGVGLVGGWLWLWGVALLRFGWSLGLFGLSDRSRVVTSVGLGGGCSGRKRLIMGCLVPWLGWWCFGTVRRSV